jgi:hypothetical protein
MSTTPVPAGTESGKLFVFLHGLIPLIEYQDQFLGLVVDMDDDHGYLAGDWLTEMPMPRGSIVELTGVTPGTASLNRTKISVIRQQKLFPSPLLYATLVLPRPAALHSLRRTEFPVDSGVLKGASLPFVSCPKPGVFSIATVQIFEYDFADASQVQLSGYPAWTPTVFRKSAGSRPSATLHFFAEPENVPDPMHHISELNANFQLFKGFDLSASGTLARVSLEMDEYPKDDLSTNETLGLMERIPLLNSVAAFYKLGQQGALPGEGDTGENPILCAGIPGCGDPPPPGC